MSAFDLYAGEPNEQDTDITFTVLMCVLSTLAFVLITFIIYCLVKYKPWIKTKSNNDPKSTDVEANTIGTDHGKNINVAVVLNLSKPTYLIHTLTTRQW